MTDNFDQHVAATVTRAGSPEKAARLLALQPDIASAHIRPGLVKTEPPLVELVVDIRDSAGGTITRVYDVRVSPDGGVNLAGRHES